MNNSSRSASQIRLAKPLGLALVLAMIFSILGGLGGQLPAAQAATAGTLTIGDCVWNDSDVDGTEADTVGGGDNSGINGVTVNLYEDKNTNGNIDSGEFMSSTLTISGSAAGATGACATAGYYQFIVDGEKQYIVEIPDSNFNAGGPLEDFVFTSGNSIGNEPRIVDALNTLQGNIDNVDFGYVKVDLRLRIDPINDFNAVNDDHVFNVFVESKIGSGSWTGEQNETPTVTIKNSSGTTVTPSPNTCPSGTDSNGQCAATINSSVAEVFTANASVTANVSVPIPNGFGGSTLLNVSRTRDTDPATSTKNGTDGTGPATKTYVDVRLTVTPALDYNAVGDTHDFVVKVEKKVGTGSWTPIQGATPSVSITNSPIIVSDSCSSPGTNSSGECTVRINSTTANTYDATASLTNFQVIEGTSPNQVTMTFDRDTDATTATPAGQNGTNGKVTKIYVDVRLTMTPALDYNAVGDTHDFVVKVEKKVGTGSWTPIQGATPSVSITNSPTIVSDSCSSPGTNSSGECTVRINSTTANTYDATASLTNFQVTEGSAPVVVTMTFDRDTNASTATPAGQNGTNGAVTKIYVDVRLTVTPALDYNAVGDTHDFVVKVEKKVGTGSWTPIQGATPSVSITNSPTIVSDSCSSPGTNSSGECTVRINSTTANTYDATASLTNFQVTEGTSPNQVTMEFDRDTDATTTTPAGQNGTNGKVTKIYVDVRLTMTPATDYNAVNDSHTFTVTVEKKVGTGTWTPIQGASPAVAVSPAPSSKTDNCAAPGSTDANGKCTVVINSTTANTYDATASLTGFQVTEGSAPVVVTMTFDRDTNASTATPAGQGGTNGAVTKIYVDVRLRITPNTATNSITDPHTFIVYVEKNVGTLNTWTGINGVKPLVTVSPSPSSITDNCNATGTTNNGSCTVVINSNNPATYVANAGITDLPVTEGGVTMTFTRDTNPATATIPNGPGGSESAEKIYVAGSIGDFIWWDINGDGIQNNNEPGIPGVTVYLYPTASCTGSSVQTKQTGGNGEYLFTNLATDEYCVGVETNEFVNNGGFGDTLVGWTLSPANTPNDDTVDSDGQSFGTNVVQIRSIKIDPVNNNPTDGLKDDTTRDIGFDKNGSHEILKVQTTDPSNLGVSVGTAVRFRITITNTGSTFLTVIPLEDTYDERYLSYVSSNIGGTNTPADTQSSSAVGVTKLQWNDLTGIGSLAPNATLVLEVVFEALADTTALTAQAPCSTDELTCNVAETTDPGNNGPVSDPDGPGPLGDGVPPGDQDRLDPEEDHDDVKILNTTSVGVTSQGAAIQSTSVTVNWNTTSEAEIIGFYLHRINADGSNVTLNDGQMIEAKNSGQANGASYSFTDNGMGLGAHADYILEVVSIKGSSDMTLAQLRSVFLPGVLK